MAQRKAQSNAKPTSIGYRPKAFTKHIEKSLSTFDQMPEGEKNGMAAILWSMFSGRMTHNSGIENLAPIHWKGKAAMFGSAKRFDAANAALGWFVLETKPQRGKSAGGWAMTDQARAICMDYLKQSHQYALTGLEPQEKGLVTAEGKPYRMPADGIRSKTSAGNPSRFPRGQIHAAIEIDGDNLHGFHHAAQAFLDGDPCPPPYRWAFDQWEALRNGRGPNAGEDAAQRRALMARDQSSIMLDVAKRSGAPGFVIPTTYRESRAGRLYAEGPINLQRCVTEVRKASLAGCYDVDIANCHWSLLAQMAERLNEPAPHILRYLANKKATRAEIAGAGAISIDDAKFTLLAMIYGATLDRNPKQNQYAIEQRLGAEAMERLRRLPLVLDLHRDVRRVGKAVLADYTAKSRKAGVIVNDAGREIGIKSNAREKLAHVLQGAESMALQSMLTALPGQVALMQHDGITIHGKPDLSELEKRITADTGYRLKLESGRL